MGSLKIMERRLKVTAAFQTCLSGRQGRKYTCCFVPQLNLCGKWLSANGFKPGDEVSIEVVENQILIKKAA
jgi:hypothetical protein